MINSLLQSRLQAKDLLAFASESLKAEAFLNELTPPKHFDHSEFSNYIPEPKYPSQSEALRAVSKFVADLKANGAGQNFFSRFKKNKPGKGLYLDGGFGIGKTHLLASAYHSFDGTKAYLSFQELMFLVGLKSLAGVAESFATFKLLVIDEFELDDPANTRITTNLLRQLFESGVSILTSSNTPPGALGEGKFSVEDFRREIGVVTGHFKTLRIEGEDYRHTHHLDEGLGSTWCRSEEELNELSTLDHSMKIVDSDFSDFLSVLGQVHPMRIRKALVHIDGVILRNVTPISHPHEALRFVYFIDKAYDNNLSFAASSEHPMTDLFPRSYFTGGDTKKYLRTLSRLKEMTQERVEV